MASIEERLQIKREPLDKWSVREQLCLAVARMNDQNLTSVSRALKPFGEANRPADWFHQKNCAAQYGALLANVETPKRKKRASGPEVVIETPAEAILRRLLSERKMELKRWLNEEKAEYLKLQEDMTLLQSGNVSEEQLDLWCKEIDNEEQKREQEQIAHTQWLRERELRKQEIERAWRPSKPINIVGQKRKNSETLENLIDSSESSGVSDDQRKTPTPTQTEPPKPALSPLLTSLLKSPSQVPNVTTSSILHSAITNTNQRPTNTNPTIASLLNSSSGPTSVSPGIQQLVTSAIGQEHVIEEGDSSNSNSNSQQNNAANDILDDANLPMLKIDDLASSILIQNGPLPEMKNDVDVIISDLIDNAQDIVADPEQHLQLDGNGDINLNLGLDDFDDGEEIKEEEDTVSAVATQSESADKESEKVIEKAVSVPVAAAVDPFEFQEDPVVFEPTPTKNIKQTEINKQTLQESQQVQEKPDSVNNKNEETPETPISDADDIKTESAEESQKKESVPGSVEIVEVVVMDDDDIDKELNKSQIEDIVHSVKTEKDDESEKTETQKLPDLIEASVFEDPQSKSPDVKVSDSDDSVKKEIEIDVPKASDTNTVTPDFNEELYEDAPMEVKVDKSGKAKRDYSRTKKKDDKEFDVLLALEKSHQDLCNETIEDLSDRDSSEIDTRKDKIKSKHDFDGGSCTSWDDDDIKSFKRRLSTPATFIDSIPDSPSSSIYDDDRDYKAWKKSVMLVYNRLSTNKYASLFSKPITDDQAPGYHSIVYRPMDLQTIRRNIESGVVRTTQEFKRDVLLMLNNAIMYNKSYDTVYNMAREMQQEAIQEIQIFVQAQTQSSDLPVRRETRTSEPGIKRKRGNEEVTRGSKKRKDD